MNLLSIMKKIVSLFAFLFAALSLFAQQDLVLSQQFFSRVNKNPAGMGNVNDLDIFLLGRYQWASMEDSPKSGVLNVQTYRDNLNSGFAFTMGYDKLGVAKQMYNPKVDYAYFLKLGDEMSLSLGLGAGIQYGYFDATKYTLSEEEERNEADILNEKLTKCSPDVDFGVEFATPRITAGASVTHLLEGDGSNLVNGRHINVYGRYIFTLSPDWDVAPMIAWMNKSKVNVVELNATAFYRRLFWGGLTYHPDVMDSFGSNPVGISAGLEWKNFRIGYTFDYNFGKVSDYAGTAHELMLSYSVRSKATAPSYDPFE